MDSHLIKQIDNEEDNHWWFRGRRELINTRLMLISSHPKSVLDVGCGTGSNIISMKKYWPNAEIIGVDTELESIVLSNQKKLKVYKAPITELPFEDNSFDLITAFDVLEHVNDLNALDEIYRVLKPGGKFFATVPAYMWLWSHHDILHQHMRRYTLPEALHKVSASKMRPYYSTYFSTLLFPAIAIFRLINKKTPLTTPPPIINKLLLTIFLIESQWVKENRTLPFGSSVYIEATKRI